MLPDVDVLLNEDEEEDEVVGKDEAAVVEALSAVVRV